MSKSSFFFISFVSLLNVFILLFRLSTIRSLAVVYGFFDNTRRRPRLTSAPIDLPRRWRIERIYANNPSILRDIWRVTSYIEACYMLYYNTPHERPIVQPSLSFHDLFIIVTFSISIVCFRVANIIALLYNDVLVVYHLLIPVFFSIRYMFQSSP